MAALAGRECVSISAGWDWGHRQSQGLVLVLAGLVGRRVAHHRSFHTTARLLTSSSSPSVHLEHTQPSSLASIFIYFSQICTDWLSTYVFTFKGFSVSLEASSEVLFSVI